MGDDRSGDHDDHDELSPGQAPGNANPSEGDDPGSDAPGNANHTAEPDEQAQG